MGTEKRHHNFKHGYGGTKIYGVWRQMRQRCENPAHKDYPQWGGRGIRVCDEWRDINAFAAWAHANGYREGVTIERVDNDRGYSPENCRWIPNERQAKNTRRQRLVTVNGRTMDVADLSRESGIAYRALIARLNLGWPHERLLEPTRRGRNQHG